MHYVDNQDCIGKGLSSDNPPVLHTFKINVFFRFEVCTFFWLRIRIGLCLFLELTRRLNYGECHQSNIAGCALCRRGCTDIYKQVPGTMLSKIIRLKR